MSIEERVAALERRLRSAEDQLEIVALLNTYGPLVDSGSSEAAADLWIEGGTYNFSGGLSGGTPLEAPADLVAMYEHPGHKDLVSTGVAHFTGMPRITVLGDKAKAIGYSFVVLREGERWFVWRAAVHEWTLVRTPDGWRIKERFNRGLDGSQDSHDTMRRILTDETRV